MKVTLNPLPHGGLEHLDEASFLRFQSEAARADLFGLHFQFKNAKFTYSTDPLEVIAEDLNEEIIKLSYRKNHSFCVSGYPLFHVIFDDIIVRFETRNKEPLVSPENFLVFDLITNLSLIQRTILSLQIYK